MAYDYTQDSNPETSTKKMAKPQKASLNFIRQFARTYIKLQGCTLGTMVIN